MAEERITDIGPPHYEQFLPPVVKKNYGKWDYHEIIKPGVMVHVAESGDKLWTVRAASPRLLAITTIRKFADEEIAPVASENDKKGEFPRDLFNKMAGLGFVGTPIPEEYGGAGGDFGHGRSLGCFAGHFSCLLFGFLSRFLRHCFGFLINVLRICCNIFSFFSGFFGSLSSFGGFFGRHQHFFAGVFKGIQCLRHLTGFSLFRFGIQIDIIGGHHQRRHRQKEQRIFHGIAERIQDPMVADTKWKKCNGRIRRIFRERIGINIFN